MKRLGRIAHRFDIAIHGIAKAARQDPRHLIRADA
jgi:hypothetical protein